MINLEDAKRLIENHKTKAIPRLEKLERYYLADHDVKNREARPDGSKPSVIINNFPKYITTIATGYFIGNEITYTSTDDLVMFQAINKLNFEKSHNADLAKTASIYGASYELNYTDEEGQYNFAEVNPKNIIIIEDGKIKPIITDAIIIDERELLDDKKEINISIYDNEKVAEYKAIVDAKDGIDKATFVLESEIQHNMGSCPIVEYKNNSDKKGDFEDVISLIDAYNDATSSSLDDLKDFTDAFLCLINMGNLDEEVITKLKKSKVLAFDEGGKAEWLTKQVNDAYSENIKNRTVKDIHKFSYVPDLNDENFLGSQQSGVAIRFKFQALEQLRQEKEMNFNKALWKRIRLINNYLTKFNKSIDLLSFDIQFQVNLPVNTSEVASYLTQLRGLVSDRSLLAQVPFIQDVEREIEEVEREKILVPVPEVIK